MSTVHDRRKALRGTKRTCQACEARFYDLGRNPIVCPMCGAHYAPSAEPLAAPAARAAPFSNKTGWRRLPVKRVQPALPVAETMPSDRFATAAADEEIEGPATVDIDDNSGVPEEQDETDVAGLPEHDYSEEHEPR
jgi:uncharacterized protein (TIGR02300 family)